MFWFLVEVACFALIGLFVLALIGSVQGEWKHHKRREAEMEPYRQALREMDDERRKAAESGHAARRLPEGTE